MAKNDIFIIYMTTESIDGKINPLKKGFREQETFTIDEFRGFPLTSEIPDGVDIHEEIIGFFTTKNKAISSLLENTGVELKELNVHDTDAVAIAEPIFDVDDDTDDRFMTTFVLRKLQLNQFTPEFYVNFCMDDNNDDTIIEVHQDFLDTFNDFSKQYGAGRDDMNEIIQMHINEDFDDTTNKN